MPIGVARPCEEPSFWRVFGTTRCSASHRLGRAGRLSWRRRAREGCCASTWHL